ncbi:uncharacterized protein [Panulirus ornatus]|uniref:uncharacterized protein n=1 Tax=Panulirus ornatus TaxID=150431 RepID=UPI003A8734D4
MSRHLQMPEGKRIHMYRSGDTFYKGVSMVVNPKYVKNIDNLLSEVTTKVDPVWGAVRSIHTPNTGTSIDDLQHLSRQGVYVAAGPRGFISVPGGYENIGKPGNKKKQTTPPKTIRYRPVQKKEIYNVYIYKNGDPGQPLPFKFTKTDFTNWDQALHRLSEKLRLPQGPAKRIYHLSGKILKNPSELVHSGSYVAATSNELFRRVDYDSSSTATLQPRVDYRASEYAVVGQRDRERGRRGSEEDSGAGEEWSGEEVEEETRTTTTVESGYRSREEEGEEGRGYEDDEEDNNTTQAARLTRTITTMRTPTVMSSRIRATHPAPSGRSGHEAGFSSSQRSPTRPSTQPSPELRTESPEGGTNRSYPGRYSKVKQPSALESTRVPHNLPSRIPEGDLSNVDYLNLRSHQGTPQQSPHETPLSSRLSSPQTLLSHRSRGDSVLSFQEPIPEECEEGHVTSSGRQRVDRGLRSESRLSLYDSGHASLLSDEERPDSVFRAKSRLSRPVTQAREVDYDTDDGGIYRAKTRADYSRGAKEVLDSSDTNIELPIDMIDAAEVQEEVYAT